jgi:hypothetical protein
MASSGSRDYPVAKRSAAVLDWLLEIRAENVLEFYGDVPVRLMIHILNLLDSSNK